MSNELIFILSAFIDLSFVLLFFKLGRRGLLASVIVNVILVATFGSKLISIFGFVTNVSNVFYSSVFLAVNIMIERFDRREGLKAIWAGFGALVVFMIMSQFVVISKSIPESASVDLAINTLFKVAPRIAFASMFAYLVSQHLNLWLYELMKLKSKLNLALRNFISTAIAQLVDSLLFFILAFSGVVSGAVLWQTISIGYLLKLVIVIISTPYIYSSLEVKLPTDPNEKLVDPEKLLQSQRKYQINWKMIGIVRALATIVSAIGVLVIGGWFFNLPLLTNLNPNFVSMKFSTAVSFFCSGVMLYFIAENYCGKKDRAALVIPAMLMVILLFMTTILVSIIFGFSASSAVAQEVTQPSFSFIVSIPSYFTMIGFTFISIVGLFTLGNASIMNLRYRRVGLVLIVIGLIALVGYLFNQPSLFYAFQGVGSGMAIHTATSFILLGIGFVTLGFSKKQLKNNEH